MNGSESIALMTKMRKQSFLEIKLCGKCMEPFLLAGDTVRIVHKDKASIGDICLISLSNETVGLHRIIALNKEEFISKGDYSGVAERLNTNCIIGTVVAIKAQDEERWAPYDPSNSTRCYFAFLSSKIQHKKGPARTIMHLSGILMRKHLLKDRAASL